MHDIPCYQWEQRRCSHARRQRGNAHVPTHSDPIVQISLPAATPVLFSAKGLKLTNIYLSVINPATGKVICQVSEGTQKDVDEAVVAAQRAFDTVWGLNCPGYERGKLLYKLAELLEKYQDEFAAVEALDNGKTFSWAKKADVAMSIGTFRYYAGWADKIQGNTIETSKDKIVYTTHEPLGVVGQIIPWNFPCTPPLTSTWRAM